MGTLSKALLLRPTICIYAASDLGLHCLPVTRLGVLHLQWVKI